MQYPGGKVLHAKYIAKIINEEINKNKYNAYVEPFCGMCSVGLQVQSLPRYFFDASEDVICYLQALQNGWLPPNELSEEEYNVLKNAECSPLRTFAMHGCSWGAKWKGGYGRSRIASGFLYPMAATSFRAALKMQPKLLNVNILQANYLDLNFTNSIIYCDPPYKNSTQSYSFKEFDSNVFWQWAEKQSTKNKIFISETSAPPGWNVVWEKLHRNDMSKNGHRLERLWSK